MEQTGIIAPNTRMKSGWNPSAMLIRGPLTDKKIEQYRKQGWYSSEFKDARKKRMNRTLLKRKREGDFIRTEDGRLIFSPL